MLLMSKTWNSPHYSVCFSPDILKKKVSFQVWPSMSKCARVKMEHLQNILFGEADQLFLYGARLLFSPSSSHWLRKGKLALDQESLSDSEDVALIRKSEKVSFGRRDQFWLEKSSTWKGSVSHNSLETGGWLEIYTGYIDWKWNWNLSRGLSITFWPTSHAKKDQLLGLVGLPPCPSWPRSIFN